MSSSNQTRANKSPARTTVSTGLAVLLIIAFASIAANAQTIVNTPVTTTLFAGTSDWSAFGLASLTTPSSGLILSGTNTSKFTGRPVRHIWYGDASNGLCRVDPEVDAPDPGLTSGIGAWQGVQQTCMGSIRAAGFVPGQMALDATLRKDCPTCAQYNYIYTADATATSKGLIRIRYIPSGGGGEGAVDLTSPTALVGSQLGRNAAGGCQPPVDPNTGQIGAQLDAVSVGPDGNVYFGYKRGGLVGRIKNPATLVPDANPTTGTNGPNCTASVDVPILSPQERLGGAGHTFGLGWINHVLFGADNIAPWILNNNGTAGPGSPADQCLTPQNGMNICGPFAGTEILASFVGGPQGGLITDAIFPTFAGNAIYAATLGQVTRITNASSGQANNMALQTQLGGAFCSITGLIADPVDLANETLYVGADCTLGGINGAGTIWKIKPGAPPPGPPAAPTNVTAVNSTPVGANSGSATVSWTPISNAQPITSYVVKTLTSTGAASGIADVPVNPTPPSTVPPTSVTIANLILGSPYEFVVEAVNGTATPPFTGPPSLPSNVVTVQVPTVPGAPTTVAATPGSLSATVAWTAPANNGGSPITSYAVTPSPAAPAGAGPFTAPGSATGLVISGLDSATSYTFTVVAVNAVGSSVPSAPSNAVMPSAGAPVLSASMTGPASVNAGGQFTDTVTITNTGAATASAVTLTETVPANATLVSASTPQGACGTTTCLISSIPPQASANVAITLQSTTAGTIVNNASVSATGITAIPTSFTTTVAPGGTPVTADIQTTGSAQLGSPTHSTSDTYTWQVKNNSGGTAPNVTFKAIYPNFTNVQASSTGSSPCAVDVTTNTVSCSTATLAVGQAMVVTVNAIVPATAGNVTVTGNGSFTGTDSNPANNSFAVTVGVK